MTYEDLGQSSATDNCSLLALLAFYLTTHSFSFPIHQLLTFQCPFLSQFHDQKHRMALHAGFSQVISHFTLNCNVQKCGTFYCHEVSSCQMLHFLAAYKH